MAKSGESKPRARGGGRIDMRAIAIVMVMAATAAAEPSVTFKGNESFTAAELRAAMPSVDDTEQYERSLLYLSAFYWDRGYANVKLSDPPWDKERIALEIDEGPKFTMGTVTVVGHEELLDRVWMRPGMTFSRTQIAEDREALSVYYQDQGYAYANVLPLTHVDLAHATIDLTFEIDRGKRARFGRITVYNAPVDVVRRELGIAEGEQFSQSKLELGRDRIRAKGMPGVVISTKRGAKEDLVDVTVELPEP